MKKLTLIDRAFFLKRLPLFSMLDLDILLAIADKLNIVAFESDQTIFGINEDAYRMYFVVKGLVEIRDSHDGVLAELGPEEFFGEESLFSEKPRAYSATSKAETTVLALSKTNLMTIISECPAVAVSMLQAYCRQTQFRSR